MPHRGKLRRQPPPHPFPWLQHAWASEQVLASSGASSDKSKCRDPCKCRHIPTLCSFYMSVYPKSSESRPDLVSEFPGNFAYRDKKHTHPDRSICRDTHTYLASLLAAL